MQGTTEKPVVSIAQVRGDDVGCAVEEAIDLLGGIEAVTRDKKRIMLKPNLVTPAARMTTKPVVIKALAQLMLGAGKEVCIGEGSAAATGFNMEGEEIYRTRNAQILDAMQQHVFDQLGYTELAQSLGIPLINLHSGDLVEVPVPDGHVFDQVTIHRALAETDLLCSVPMMKTHSLAVVTLGMKNMIGCYPGTVYYAVRAWLHDRAAEKDSVAIAYETLDMVKATNLGLVVVDGSMAMEGQGPNNGEVFKMGIIVAGTNPLATDMVTAHLMGFAPEEVPTFFCAHEDGMTPTRLEEIELRGVPVDQVRRPFKKPEVVPWTQISEWWGVKEIA